MPPLSLNFNTLVTLLCPIAVSRRSESVFDPCLSALPDPGAISSVYLLILSPKSHLCLLCFEGWMGKQCNSKQSWTGRVGIQPHTSLVLFTGKSASVLSEMWENPPKGLHLSTQNPSLKKPILLTGIYAENP